MGSIRGVFSHELIRRSGPYSQNGKPSKINPRKVVCFSTPKNTMQFTTIYHAIHHNFTTIYHHKTHQNLYNPL
jgi:hypothetical protein